MSDILLTVHMVVKNEDRFIWYALNSVLPYVDKVIIFDTGSTDKTVEIINSFADERIKFQSIEIKEAKDIGRLRQQQIEETNTPWFWIVDGDEIYHSSLCKEIVNIVRKEGKNLEGIVVGRYDLLGDVYHFQDESVGKYNLFDRQGHFVLRLINKENIAGLHVEGLYPYEGYYDKNGQELINHDKQRFYFAKGRLFHAMYLQRSTHGASLSDTLHRNKWKIELGKRIKDKKLIPEVFYQPHPVLVPDSYGKRSIFYELAANLVTPIKIFKRKLWKFLNI